jgi:hypothetical protein
MEKRPYSNRLDGERQVSMEEKIAAMIFDRAETEGCENCGTLNEEDCAQLGRDILYVVLKEFRPSYIEK